MTHEFDYDLITLGKELRTKEVMEGQELKERLNALDAAKPPRMTPKSDSHEHALTFSEE